MTTENTIPQAQAIRVNRQGQIVHTPCSEDALSVSESRNR